MLALIFKYISVVIGLGQGTKPLTAVGQPQKVNFVGKVIFCACKEFNINVLEALKVH